MEMAEGNLAGHQPRKFRGCEAQRDDLSGPDFIQYRKDPFWIAVLTVSHVSKAWRRLIRPLLPYPQLLTGTRAAEWLNDISSSMVPYMTESETQLQATMRKWFSGNSDFVPTDYTVDKSPLTLLSAAQTQVDEYNHASQHGGPTDAEKMEFQRGISTIRFLLIGLVAPKVGRQ